MLLNELIHAKFDIITLIIDMPKNNLKNGMKGTIIDTYSQPYEAYEVEFCEGEGRTVAQLALTLDQFE